MNYPLPISAFMRVEINWTKSQNSASFSSQVCLDVTEMNCHVEPYTDCKMSYEEVPYRSYEMVKKEYNTKTCTESTEVVQQTKTAPECKYV